MISKFMNDIQFIRQLDTGAFSSVWLALHETTHKYLAIKIYRKFVKNCSKKTKETKDSKNDINLNIDHAKKNHFKTELNILSKIDHPFILGYFGDFEDNENQYICLEYAPNGSLLDYININQSTRGIDENVARHIFTELLLTVEYLHKHLKIFHRDLKCENVLIDSNNNIRLNDFGFSVVYKNPNDIFDDKIGSLGYASPEMLNNVSYTPEKTDVWCLGIILYMMLVGKHPFEGKNEQETSEKIACKEPEYPDFLNENSVDLLKKMLTKNPYRRADISMIKNHPYINQTELSILSKVDPIKSNMSAIDQSIHLESLMKEKIDPKKLLQKSSDCKINDEMLMFKLLKRNQITKLLNEIVEGKIESFDQSKIKFDLQSNRHPHDSLVGRYIEEKNMDDEYEYENDVEYEVSKKYIGNFKGGISTPNLLSYKTLNAPLSSQKKDELKKFSNIDVIINDDPFALNSSISAPALSSMSNGKNEPIYRKKNMIKISSKKKTNLSTNGLKTIISLIH